MNCRNRYAGLLVLHLLSIWSPWFIVFTFGNAHLNGLKQFLFIILVAELLIILIDCLIFLLPFLDVTRISISTVHFFVHLNWNMLPVECFPLIYDLNGFYV